MFTSSYVLDISFTFTSQETLLASSETKQHLILILAGYSVGVLVRFIHIASLMSAITKLENI